MEAKEKVNLILRSIDNALRGQNFDKALALVQEVYVIDPRNAYARAFEERLNELLKSKSKAEPQPKKTLLQTTLDEQRAKEVLAQQQQRLEKERSAHEEVRNLEIQARKAFNLERHEYAKVDYLKIEEEYSRRLEEMEHRLLKNISKLLAIEKGRSDAGAIQETRPPHFGSERAALEAMRQEYEMRLLSLQKEFETTLKEQISQERNAIEESTIRRLQQYHNEDLKQLIEQMEKERSDAVEQERERMRKLAFDVLIAQLTMTAELKLNETAERSLANVLMTAFSLQEEDLNNATTQVRLMKYIEAVRSAWSNGEPSDTEKEALKNLQALNRINNEEAAKIQKKVKRWLGYPDEDAVVLVVDDEDDILEFVVGLVKNHVATAFGASSVEQAVEWLSKQPRPPALIISDVRLPAPGIGGFTFFERLKEGVYGEHLKNTKFVLMSGITDEFFIKTAKQMGVIAYMLKPFTVEEMEEGIRSWLKGSAS